MNFDNSALVLMNALRAIAPPNSTCAGGLIAEASGHLYPEERLTMANVVRKRWNEYYAGRCYARAAMAALGMPDAAIPTAKSREPIWPSGLIGSISHSGDMCAAIVARRAEVIGIGMDIEYAAPLHEGLETIVCMPSELAAHKFMRLPEGIDAAKLYFVIKESVYKLYFPLARHFLDFHDVHVSLDVCAKRFTAVIDQRCPALRGQHTVFGQFNYAIPYSVAVAHLSLVSTQ